MTLRCIPHVRSLCVWTSVACSAQTYVFTGKVVALPSKSSWFNALLLLVSVAGRRAMRLCSASHFDISLGNSENLWGVLVGWGKIKTSSLKSTWPVHRILGAGRDLMTKITISQWSSVVKMSGRRAGPGTTISEFWPQPRLSSCELLEESFTLSALCFVGYKIRIKLIANTYRKTQKCL